jgi:glycolate oxidase
MSASSKRGHARALQNAAVARDENVDRRSHIKHPRQHMPLAPKIISDLQQIVGAENVLTAQEDLIPYSFDGTAAMKQLPGCVVFARNTEHVTRILKLANETKTPVVTRGSGTGLSGGSLPVADGIVLCLVKIDKILELDRANLTMLVETGVTTLAVSDAA